MPSLERFAAGLFAGDQEAVNFSAHVAWSLVFSLGGHAVGGSLGLIVGAGTWILYSLVNEFLLHGPEGSRERTLNLISRLSPSGLLLILALVRLWRHS